MLKKISGVFIFVLSFSIIYAQTGLKKGLVINKSIKIKKQFMISMPTTV